MSVIDPEGPVFEQGNPLLILASKNPGERVVVVSESLGRIWASHHLSTASDSVRVDVWSGRFQGSAQGWAILPPGRYTAWLESASGERAPLCTFAVAGRRIFNAGPGDDGWLQSDLALLDGTRGHAGFREGAMHGALTGVFEATRPPQHGSEWGLISRHYNAFHHLRLVCRHEQDGLCIKLVRLANTPPDVIGHEVIEQVMIHGRLGSPMTLTWQFNGSDHRVLLDGKPVLTAADGYMGGVEIVGCFEDGRAVKCSRLLMETSQTVLRQRICRSTYAAEIRPGNVDRIFLLASAAPDQNIAWESGIQFGHIGGAEIKFTQGASLDRTDDGEVAVSVAWRGPMPKFVEQADDVRGWAHGTTCFYDDHFVIADNVLTWTNRSVGPDIDLLGRLVAGPARLARATDAAFRDWNLPVNGQMAFVEPAADGATFPAAVLIPLRLGRQLWWLKALIILRYPDPQTTPAAIFAWQCPHGLTASHDFRCSPTWPGQEYAFTIAVAWQRCDSRERVEVDLLQWREEWTHPMRIEPVDGVAARDVISRDQSSDAINLDGSFDRTRGAYVIRVIGSRVVVRLDPSGRPRRRPIFMLCGCGGKDLDQCRLNGTVLERGRHFALQATRHDTVWLQLFLDLASPATLEVEFKPLS